MYIVTYRGKFAFIKPWTAVRDGETFSQQFLTPSIIEGIEKKLFPELLPIVGIHKILRHKLSYSSMSSQQEVTLPRGWEYKKKEKYFFKEPSILKRNILLSPILYLVFETEKDAIKASQQHICLCRNEDIMLPDSEIKIASEEDFASITGFELRFGESDQSFLVGYNRFEGNKPMYGWLEYNGQSFL